jgi:hypothetical protein
MLLFQKPGVEGGVQGSILREHQCGDHGYNCRAQWRTSYLQTLV